MKKIAFIFCLFVVPSIAQINKTFNRTSSYIQEKEVYIFKENNKQGLVDTSGVVKIPATFDQIIDLKADDWQNSYAYLVKSNNNVGLISFSGKVILPAHYNAITCKNDTCIVSKDKKYGLIDTHGKIIIPLQYDGLDFPSQDKIAALKDGKWGYINLKNQWVILPQFDQNKYTLSHFREGFAKICNQETKKCGYINTEGQIIIPIQFDEFSGDFHNGLAKTEVNNRLAYINTSGKIAFPSNWNVSDAADFINGVAQVSKNCKNYDDYTICEHYLINTKGDNIVPKNYLLDKAFPEQNYNIIRHCKTNLKGVIDNVGNFIIPPNFIDIDLEDSIYQWFTVSDTNQDGYELSGYYNRTGKKLTNCIYSICGSYTDTVLKNPTSFICIENPNSQGRGVLNSRAKQVLPPVYDTVELAESIFMVQRQNKCGYFTIDGLPLTPIKYTSCTVFNNSKAIVQDNVGYSIIDTKAKILKRLGKKYNDLTQFSNGVAAFSRGNKIGFINQEGIEIISPTYDYTYHYNNIIQVRIANKYGVINNKGKIIVPIQYDDTSLFSCNGKIFAIKAGLYYWFDLNGKQLSNKIPLEQCQNFSNE